MKAKELRKYLLEVIELNPEAECFIDGMPVGVNSDDVGDVDLYAVAEDEIREIKEERFYDINLEKNNILDATTLLNDNELVGLVDEKQGGIIGYVNQEFIRELLLQLNNTPRTNFKYLKDNITTKVGCTGDVKARLLLEMTHQLKSIANSLEKGTREVKK